MNTSGEANKNGIELSEVVETVKHIVTSCSNLKFCGLMTIGDLGNSIAASTEVNKNFICNFKLTGDIFRAEIQTFQNSANLAPALPKP